MTVLGPDELEHRAATASELASRPGAWSSPRAANPSGR